MAKTILVVDDEKDIVLTVKTLMEQKGYTVLTAFDGKEAYSTAVHNNPDLIISDIIMPGLNGHDLLKKIKNHKTIKDIPIILLTQKDSFDDIFRAYGLGAANFLPKPFDGDTLIQAVENILEQNSRNS